MPMTAGTVTIDSNGDPNAGSVGTMARSIYDSLVVTIPFANFSALTAAAEQAAKQQVADIANAVASGVVSHLNDTFFTPEGGFCELLTNKTGSNSVKGTLVQLSSTTDRAFALADTSDVEPIGVVYDDGVADGSLCRVVVSGIAEALIEAADTIQRGYWAGSGVTTSGRVTLAAAVPAPTQHFTEVGHCMETLTNTGTTLARIALHFN